MSTRSNQPTALEAPRSGEPAPGAPSTTLKAQRANNAEQAFFQLNVKRSVQMHRRLALSIAASGLVLAALYFLITRPAYVAQSMVYVQPVAPRVLEQGPVVRWPYDASTYESYFQQQLQNVTRADVLTNALHKLDGSFTQANESEQAAIDRLAKAVEVKRFANYQFTIAAHAPDPALAAQISNAVANAYIETASHEQRAGDTQRLAMLRDERDRVQKALDADRAEQESLNKQLGVASIGALPDHYDLDISQIRSELVKARTDHDAAAAKFQSMGAGHGASSAAIDAEADSLAAADAGLVSMKTALNARRAVLITQMANLTPSHPQYKQDAEELAQINGTLDNMMRDLRAKAAARIQLQLRSDLTRTANVEAQLNGQLGQLVGAATGATPKMQRSSDLAADITRQQARFATVDEQLHNLMLEENAPSAASISAPAVAPLVAAHTGKLRNTALIALAGIFFGLLAAVVAHKADPNVYVAAEVEHVLGFAPMAQIPDFSEVSESAAEEHLLRFAAALEHARKQGHLKSCIFTGASAGAGVTTLVTRVRAMLEAMGRPTVLVDASGNSSAEEDSASSDPFAPGSRALVAAQRGSRPTALLQQMAEESGRETLVLTDTAPLAVSAETEYLARFADCAIVVIQSGVTTREEIRAAASTLQRLHVRTVGFVVNRVGLAKADPAFRNSVAAIEKRIDSQGSSKSRRMARNEPGETAEERAEALNPPPRTAANGAVWADVQPRTVSAEPAPPVDSHIPRQRDPIVPPAPEPVASAEWRLAESPAAPVPAPAGLLWQPARSSGSLPVAGSVPVQAPAAPISSPQPVQPKAWPPPSPSWHRDPEFTNAPASGPEAQPYREPEPTEPPADLPSRLGGLRNLLFTLGLKETDAVPEPAALPGVPTLPFDRASERQVYASDVSRPPAPAAEPLNIREVDQARVVSARPEVLPPSPAVEKKAPVSPPSEDSVFMGGHETSFQGVRTLPARRGQYKKR